MQWYTHDGNILDTINDDRCALRFRGHVMFTLLDDRGGRHLSVAPVLNYTDHKSGQRYLSPPPKVYKLSNGPVLGIGSLFDQCCNQIYSGSTILPTSKFMHLLSKFNAPHFSSI